MHQIGIVGLSYRHAPTDEVARFAIPKAEILARLPQLRQALRAAEIVYVGTCNRVEVVFATRDDAPAGDCRSLVFRELSGREPAPGEAASALRAWTGEAAVEHLLLVACGLDSAQAGEREIAAQIRGAWEEAREAGVSGALLDRLFGEALATARQVQRLGDAGPAPSLADLGVEHLVRHLQGRAEAPVALVGVSPMTRRCGESLSGRGMPLLVVNRSLDTGLESARALGARMLPLDEFRARPPEVAALVLAAGSSEPVLDEAALRRIASAARRPPLLVDFGLPANVDPEAAQRVGLPRIGMNELVGLAQRQRTEHLLRLAPVRAAVDGRLARLRTELAARALGPRLSDLRSAFERIAAAEVDKLLATELRDLDENQRETLQRWAGGIARRLAHLPLSGIRAAAEHASAEAVDAFFREARLSRVPPTDETLQ